MKNRTRNLVALITVLLAVIAIANPKTELTELEKGILGSWKSPDLGLDFPIWMVDTYAGDHTVQTDFYSKPKDEVIHHKDKVMHAHWRIANNALEVGKLDEAGTFTREGQPRPIKTDSAGKVTSIADWTRVDSN